MPRPRTHTQAARTQAITVRVTPSRHASLSAEAAQRGISLAGLAERYLSKETVKLENATQPARLHPALLAELKRAVSALDAAASHPSGTADIASALRGVIQALIRDELLAARLNAIQAGKSANDSAPPSPRDEFQRVVYVRTPRS